MELGLRAVVLAHLRVTDWRLGRLNSRPCSIFIEWLFSHEIPSVVQLGREIYRQNPEVLANGPGVRIIVENIIESFELVVRLIANQPWNSSHVFMILPLPRDGSPCNIGRWLSSDMAMRV